MAYVYSPYEKSENPDINMVDGADIQYKKKYESIVFRVEQTKIVYCLQQKFNALSTEARESMMSHILLFLTNERMNRELTEDSMSDLVAITKFFNDSHASESFWPRFYKEYSNNTMIQKIVDLLL